MNITAPVGYVWVCFACGKRSHDKYGDAYMNKGWDASCMLNSRMVASCDISLSDHRVSQVNGPTYETIEEINNA